jgi:acyl carrier protein
VQLVARLREMFGVKLTLRQLFDAPTVAALSSAIERQTSTQHV